MLDALATSSGAEVNAWLVEGSSGIHGRGLFARRAIPAGTPVIEYVGEKITKAESALRCEAENHYIFSLDDEWDLDGNMAWNPARFINHSCVPNCEAIDEESRIWVYATRDIEVGEEISFNYGYDIEDFVEHPCRCGAPGCVGFMVAEEFFPLVRRRGVRESEGT